jgi:hypothetical protein
VDERRAHGGDTIGVGGAARGRDSADPAHGLNSREAARRLDRGIPRDAAARDDLFSAVVLNVLTLRLVNLDPNTHAFVLATAALTSITFAISSMNVLAVVLSHILR